MRALPKAKHKILLQGQREEIMGQLGSSLLGRGQFELVFETPRLGVRDS